MYLVNGNKIWYPGIFPGHDNRFKNSENNGNQNGDNGQRNNNGNFRSRGQGRGNLRGNIRGNGRGRGRFDKSPNIRRPRVASKTVDKDKMRCHYCNEFGHFIRECSKKNRDENKTGHFNWMSMDYYEDDLYTGEDYDDDVFATSTPLTPIDFQTPQYIPNYEKICLTKEETEYVYSSVKNGTK